MDRVQEVFNKIKEVLDIIKNFFEELFANFMPKEEAPEDAE